MAILTISREYGSGGREIGHAVARLMGYGYVDKEDILADIRKDGPKWEEWAAGLDEHRPTIWEKFDWSFRGFAALVQSHLLEHALANSVVIMGRGGNFLLRDVPFAFRVRVTAPLNARIERIVGREGVDRETAHWLCEKTDRERASFLHTIFGRRWDDPAEYDAVYVVQGRSVDDVVASVQDELTERHRRETEASRHALHMIAAAARIKAGIAVDPRFFVPLLDVAWDGKELVLRSVVHTPKEHKEVEEAARKLAGDLPVRCDLHYRNVKR